MATFRYAPTRYVAAQGIANPNTPIAVSTQGILVPVGIFADTNIKTGGSAPVCFYDAATSITIADYAPSGYEGYVTGSDATFVVTLDGVLEVNYKPSATVGYRFGGAADAIAPGIFIGEGGIVTGGGAPITTTIGGLTTYEYDPSYHEGYVTNGDALVVSVLNGVICVDYKPEYEGYITDGQAHVTTVIDGTTTFCYFPDPRLEDGYVCGGTADAEAVLIGKARGGKGVPLYRRRIQPQRTIHYYNAHAYFDATIQVGGSAEYAFVPAKYTFIKSLPRLPQEELEKKDGEFRKYYDYYLKNKPAKTFTYEPTGKSNLSFGGRNDATFFDFSEWVITLDDDYLIVDALSTEENPFITTVFDRDKKLQVSREDDEILDILELL